MNNYIKMCKQAKEIQKIRKEKCYIKGDHYWFEDNDWVYDGSDNFLIWEDFDWEKSIWLPTQEQLQEMMPKSDVTSLVEFIKNVELRYHDRFDKSAAGYFTGTFESFNELWLAFVMKEKWDKVWIGENWVKAE